MPRRPSSGDRAGGLGSAIAKKIDRLSSRQSRHLGVPVGNILAWKWRRCGYDFDATMLRIGSMKHAAAWGRISGHPLPRLEAAFSETDVDSIVDILNTVRANAIPTDGAA
jgi:hypothetical protein